MYVQIKITPKVLQYNVAATKFLAPYVSVPIVADTIDSGFVVR